SKLLFFLALGTSPEQPSFAAITDVETRFLQPPATARPWVYWFWLDGNVTREGITADLESMQRVGIGGAILFDVSQDIPPGPIRFGSPEWHGLVQHAVREAARLGLQLTLHNGAGWSGSGGPWVTPDLAMQKVTWAKTNLTGPMRFSGPLPALAWPANSAHDIAALAFPALVSDGATVPGFAPKMTASLSIALDNLLDKNPATSITIPAPAPKKPQYLQLEF